MLKIQAGHSDQQHWVAKESVKNVKNPEGVKNDPENYSS